LDVETQSFSIIIQGVPGWASEGCIILPPTLRREIWNSNDKELLVVP
jgi:hypothetical protein